MVIFGSTRSPTICTKLITKGSQLADGFYGCSSNFGILMTNGYHKMTQNDTKWHKMTQNDTKWHIIRE